MPFFAVAIYVNTSSKKSKTVLSDTENKTPVHCIKEHGFSPSLVKWNSGLYNKIFHILKNDVLSHSTE